jgi:hypothetical protein
MENGQVAFAALITVKRHWMKIEIIHLLGNTLRVHFEIYEMDLHRYFEKTTRKQHARYLVSGIEYESLNIPLLLNIFYFNGKRWLNK